MMVHAMDLSGISKSQVFKLRKDIDERSASSFTARSTAHGRILAGATYLKAHDGGRIIPVPAIIAVAVSTDGRRDIVGLGIGLSEAEPFWSGS